jgi:hypothetical protein
MALRTEEDAMVPRIHGAMKLAKARKHSLTEMTLKETISCQPLGLAQ